MNSSWRITIILSIGLAIPSFLQAEDSKTSVHSLNYVAPKTVSGIDPENLTDAQKQVSENYMHEGLAQRTYQELCKENQDACDGSSATVFGDTGDQIVGALSKAYAMVLGVSDGKIEIGPGKAEAKEGAAEGSTAPSDSTANKDITNNKGAGKETGDTREVNDYCKYIATAGEAVGTVMQTTGQSNIDKAPAEGDSAQKQLLFKAARSHETRADTSKIQTYAWGGTAGCYAGMIAYSGFTAGGGPAAWNTTKSVGLKLAASTFLTGFFAKLTGEHQAYAKKVKEIANQMPGKGDCNPVTDVDCYCTQPETKYDPSYCATGLHKQELNTGDVRVTCLDANMQSDPECNCLKTNNCGSKQFITDLSKLGLGNNFVASSGKTMKNLTEGRLLSADLAQAMIDGNAAQANKKKLEELSKSIPPVSLTAEQRKEADAMQNYGIPANIASRLAAMPVTPQVKAAEEKLKKLATGSATNKTASEKAGNILYFGGEGKKAATKKDSTNPFAQFGKKNEKKKAAGEVLQFGDKAQAEAQISKADGKSLFDIISRRYLVSGMKKLNGEE